MSLFKVTITRLDDDAKPSDMAIFETTVRANSMPLAALEFAGRIMEAHRNLYLEIQRLEDLDRAKQAAQKFNTSKKE